MPLAHAYLRPPHRPGRAESAKRQLRAIRRYCARRGLTLAGIFADGPDTARTPWLERPAGQRLAAALTPCAHVVTAALRWVYSSPADVLAVVEAWRPAGVTWHILVKPEPGRAAALTTAGTDGDYVVGVLRERVAREDRRRAAIRSALAERKRAGRRHCLHAGYGQRWAGPKGRQVRQPDP